MLTSRQFWVLTVVGVVFWALATAQIRWLPDSITGPVAGAITFVTSVPVGWLSVWIARRCASLSREQLPAGIIVCGATAMLIDGAVLHWVPHVYGSAETTVRLGAAWLLWGYGVAFSIAFLISRPRLIKAENISTVTR
jgi:hypothetical protein